jgi:alginate O-acetyltransferase complex protein AlgI
MLFNSPEFVLGFLPVALGAFFLAGRLGGTPWALAWMVAASLFFYGWWNPPFVLLLTGSILANFALGRQINLRGSRSWLIAGVVANLALLGWFKLSSAVFLRPCRQAFLSEISGLSPSW